VRITVYEKGMSLSIEGPYMRHPLTWALFVYIYYLYIYIYMYISIYIYTYIYIVSANAHHSVVPLKKTKTRQETEKACQATEVETLKSEVFLYSTLSLCALNWARAHTCATWLVSVVAVCAAECAAWPVCWSTVVACAATCTFAFRVTSHTAHMHM